MIPGIETAGVTAEEDLDESRDSGRNDSARAAPRQMAQRREGKLPHRRVRVRRGTGQGPRSRRWAVRGVRNGCYMARGTAPRAQVLLPTLCNHRCRDRGAGEGRETPLAAPVPPSLGEG